MTPQAIDHLVEETQRRKFADPASKFMILAVLMENRKTAIASAEMDTELESLKAYLATCPLEEEPD